MTRILVVDDDEDIVQTISTYLHEEKFEVGEAYDGVEAILSILLEKWDIVLMDFRMPKLDGVNALRIIRRIDPELRVITFTGQSCQNDMVESMKLGADTCLLKPLRLDDLFKAIQMIQGV
jgi:two-component system response regulator AtoC